MDKYFDERPSENWPDKLKRNLFCEAEHVVMSNILYETQSDMDDESKKNGVMSIYNLIYACETLLDMYSPELRKECLEEVRKEYKDIADKHKAKKEAKKTILGIFVGRD